MFDTRPALADMASQIRACRTAEGLTLQQLASRSGVAASTIHKVESQQMVPTVSVLLKIAKGLGTRPEDLIRDNLWDREADDESPDGNAETSAGKTSTAVPRADAKTVRDAGVWRLLVNPQDALPVVVLNAHQHAMVLVESGSLQLQTRSQQVEMKPGDCIEVAAGERIQSSAGNSGPTRVTLIVAPPGDIESVLGAPEPKNVGSA